MLYIKKYFKYLVIFTAVIVLTFYDFGMDDGKILRNVYVENVNVSRLTKSDAENKLGSQYNHLLNLPFEITVGDSIKSTTLKSIGVGINLPQTIAQAYSVGRRGLWYKKIYEKIKSIFHQEHFPLQYSLNEAVLNQKMIEYFPTSEQPAQNAILIYNANEKSFTPQPENVGHILNRQRIISTIDDDITNFYVKDIHTEVITDYPQITLDGLLSAKNKAQNIIGASPYLLILADDEIVPLDSLTIASFIQFMPDKSGLNRLDADISTSTIKTFLNTVGVGFNKPVINATLVVEDHKVTAFNLPQEGRTLDIDKSAPSILEALNNQQKEIKIYFTYQQPIIDAEKIKEYGLTAKLGEGMSNFFGSSESRKFNIELGASKFNGLLIKPNEEFSFNQILGDVNKEHGWKAELVIKNGAVSPDYGGGLCQVSTTMFRSAVSAGLQITERYPHAFPVRYYDPQGFDATIYPPSPDLKFINNTPNYILIQSKIEGNNLYFEMFGTSDKRIVKILGPIILNQKTDGSLQAKLTQQVWKNGEMWFEKIFYSNYQSPSKFKIQRNPLE